MGHAPHSKATSVEEPFPATIGRWVANRLNDACFCIARAEHVDDLNRAIARPSTKDVDLGEHTRARRSGER